jgi:ABC-type transport system involved in multi-copper enzyme maturation permease subunit
MGLVFMFGVPLLITGMFYLMFGRIAGEGEFSLPPTSIEAKTLSELVVQVLQSEDLADLLAVSTAPDAQSAQAAVDSQRAQVAVIIPEDFSRQFADPYGQSTIEFYQDPTLTLGPGIVKSVLGQFMDGLSGVKIAVGVALNQLEGEDAALIGPIIQDFLANSRTHSENLSEEFLEVRSPGNAPVRANPLARIIGPIMGGMMIFYAFFTGVTSGQSILREEERLTLQRLFTTPTAQSTILSGKFLAAFLTVTVQMTALVICGELIFRIEWGELASVILMILGTVSTAASFGIFVNSFLKDTKQSGIIFGGVLTFSGMLGMIRVFAIGSASATRLGNSVSLLAPQGWAIRGLLQAMDGEPGRAVLISTLVMLVWSAAFFSVGVWRFNKRYGS